MDNNNNNPQGGNGDKNNNRRGGARILITLIFAAIITLIAISSIRSVIDNVKYKETSYTEFYNSVNSGRVSEVNYESDKITYKLRSDEEYNKYIDSLKANETNGATESTSDTENTPQTSASAIEWAPTQTTEENENTNKGIFGTIYYTGYVNDPQLLNLMKERGVVVNAYIPEESNVLLETLLIYVLPVVIMVIFMSFLLRRMGGGRNGIMGVGKSPAKLYKQDETGVTFKDVAGQEEAKESLQEIVDFLKKPEKYSHIGAKLPKGALLVGPPGTGKTLLARAVAGEAGVPFFSLSGSDFVEMFVGVGASRVRDLFKEAKNSAPSIIFIDEIDAIGKSRDSRISSGNDEREQTLNQLLAEMDGFDSNEGLFILAATNRPEILDKALLRPGRLDRRIIVDKPDLKGREAILKVHAKKVKLDETVDLHEIALATSGAVGSDLANMINEAAIGAVQNGRRAIAQKDLWEAVEVVIAGKEKKDRILSKEEKRIVSYHEVGHALVTALQKDAEPVQKITIVPRTMGALGYVMQVPEEEKYLMTKDELIARLITILSGRAAEEIVFPSVTTGASNDIEQATSIARSMITRYGMSKEFGLMGLETVQDQYLEGRSVSNVSDATETKIDNEIKELLEQCYEEAKRLLRENRTSLDLIAEFLFRNETITGKEFMYIFRKCQADPSVTIEELEEGIKNKVYEKEDVAEKIDASENVSENGDTAEKNTSENETVSGNDSAAENGEVSDNDKTAKNDVTSDNSDIATSENNADPDNTNNAE